MKLEFHPEAEVELIEAHPGIGAPADPDLRRFILNRFPFTLYYSATSDVLRIEVVAHQSRRPGYWRTRVDR